MNYSTNSTNELYLKSVNWHFWPYCNYKCVFCFANFKELKLHKRNYLNIHEGKQLLKLLSNHGSEKITFVGGEPLLSPYLPKYLQYSKKLGMLTSIVTNGSKLNQDFLEKNHQYIDMIGISIDSTSDMIEKKLGRGRGHHISHIEKIIPLIKKYNIKLKVNITLTKLSINENFSELLIKWEPDKIKVFQVLGLKGENDKKIVSLQITDQEFQEFIKRHNTLELFTETSEMMKGSYVMIDPLGRFFHNTNGYLEYSDPILDVGIVKAWNQIKFDSKKFVERGGLSYQMLIQK